MVKLIYSAMASLDGYIEDEDGKLDWAEPDEETLSLADSRHTSRTSRGSGGRPTRFVYSKTLETVSSATTRIQREFDPEAVRQLNASAERDLTVEAPRQCPPRARAAGRTPFRQRHRSPALPHQNVKQC